MLAAARSSFISEEQPSLFHYLTTDPVIVGVVAWGSLLVTVVGFVIAYKQLTRVESATAAARNAVAQMTDIVRSQEQSAKINSALEQLRSADGHLRRENLEAAVAYLYVGLQVLREARELTGETDDHGLIASYILVVSRIHNDIRPPTRSLRSGSRAVAERSTEMNRVLDGLGDMAARVRIRLSRIGATRNE